MTDFLNSNFFIALSTIVTGVVVILVYKLQKRKEKRESATIILMEVRNAESAIENIKHNNVIYNISILPNNSWIKFNYLFVKDFDRDELDSLNNFYSQCYLAETAAQRLNNVLPLAIEEKAKLVQHKLLELAERHKDKSAVVNLQLDSDYAKEKKKIFETYFQDADYFIPKQPMDDLLKYINSINSIMMSPIGNKLKKIARV